MLQQPLHIALGLNRIRHGQHRHADAVHARLVGGGQGRGEADRGEEHGARRHGPCVDLRPAVLEARRELVRE
eukprot:6334752-Alexandrium_andersonii.AAC.1